LKILSIVSNKKKINQKRKKKMRKKRKKMRRKRKKKMKKKTLLINLIGKINITRKKKRKVH